MSYEERHDACSSCNHPKTAHLEESGGCTRIITHDAAKMICPCRRIFYTERTR